MPNTYKYGSLQSSYFTNFEKLWIEGFLKESKQEDLAKEDNAAKLMQVLSHKGTTDIKTKSLALLEQAHMFSQFVKESFNTTWNRALQFTMKRVQPKESLNESDVQGATAAVKWWLNEAPKQINEKLGIACFDNIVRFTLKSDGEFTKKLGRIDLIRDKDVIASIRPTSVLESIDKLKGKRFKTFEGINTLLAYEPILQFIPEAPTLLNGIAWTAENIKKLEATKK